MANICQECLSKLSEKGYIAELYYFISEYYIRLEYPLFLYEPSFGTALHYLEIHGFIMTTEAFDDVIFVKPLLHAIVEEQGNCSGYCQKVLDKKLE